MKTTPTGNRSISLIKSRRLTDAAAYGMNSRISGYLDVIRIFIFNSQIFDYRTGYIRGYSNNSQTAKLCFTSWQRWRCASIYTGTGI